VEAGGPELALFAGFTEPAKEKVVEMRVQARRDGIKNVPAIELAARTQIQRSDEQQRRQARLPKSSTVPDA
jgi:hypothetical protein